MEFQQKDMLFRRLGPSGLRVPLFSLGGWLTLGGSVKEEEMVTEIIKVAYENGINMFDTAEAYAKGQSEIVMGKAFKTLGMRRQDIIVTTKLFWGIHAGPNGGGLSRKHIIEGTQSALERLQLSYVDVIFAHRPDRTVPMEEVVRAFNFVIDKGWAFYWATSEWSAREIEEAYHVADKLNLIPPIAEQCKHHMFHRARPEVEYAPIYAKYGVGTTVFSALAGGILTGKYNKGIPEGSRFDTHKDFFKQTVQGFSEAEGKKQFDAVDALMELAKELECTVAQLALAWVARKPNTSTVILGASKPEQVLENLKALQVIPKLTPEIDAKIEEISNNAPEPDATFGRPPLDKLSRTLY